jgi:hypothetical protein
MMEWVNIHRSTLGSAEFIGCEPVQRATWLCLLTYCFDQENGGRIENAQNWPDRQWQQIVRVTKEEVLSVCPLWTWDNSSLIVWSYPLEKEQKVQKNRENGRIGGQAKTQAKTQASRVNGAGGGRPELPKNPQIQGITQASTQAPNPSENPTEEKKRKEKKREGLEGSEERNGEHPIAAILESLTGQRRLEQQPGWIDAMDRDKRLRLGNLRLDPVNLDAGKALQRVNEIRKEIMSMGADPDV